MQKNRTKSGETFWQRGENTVHTLRHVLYLQPLTHSHEDTSSCHFCIERLTACMSDFSLGKRAATDQAAKESP